MTNCLLCRDLTLELPFTLTQPKPRPVISKMVTFPQPSTTHSTPADSAEGVGGVADEWMAAEVSPLCVRPSLASVHDAIDHNLINFDT